MSEIDLELVETDAMLRELSRRFDNLVVVGEKDADENHHHRQTFSHCKNLYTGIALLELAKLAMATDLRHDAEEIDDL